MKKNLTGAFAILFALAYLPGYKCTPSKQALLTPVAKTLNGFDSVGATTMIATFRNSFIKDGNDTLVSNDVSPKSVYTLFTRDEIQEMYDLLTSAAETKADGIRIYLGSDPKPAGSSKLKVHLFLVSTYKPGKDTTKHRDYYQHTADYLGAAPFGDATDDDAKDAPGQGGLLYGDPVTTTTYFPSGICNDNTGHYIQNSDALKWVQQRGDSQTGKSSDPSGYNTRSEWFNIGFIDSLFKTIADTSNHFTGLRIYLGEGRIDEQKRVRDVFILIPTKQVGTIVYRDDYECMENSFRKDHIAYDKGELCPYNCND